MKVYSTAVYHISQSLPLTKELIPTSHSQIKVGILSQEISFLQKSAADMVRDHTSHGEKIFSFLLRLDSQLTTIVFQVPKHSRHWRS